ncbi:MAG: hypothetical protein H7A25_24110 [Leptospiraceae bacterium]|nr:hypothetical protein [Leptospiraceae bacterium]MCP5503007.1 hypothetical protein [Leptospiraceae bacterium]
MFSKPKIFLIDDHSIFLLGLQKLILEGKISNYVKIYDDEQEFLFDLTH